MFKPQLQILVFVLLFLLLTACVQKEKKIIRYNLNDAQLEYIPDDSLLREFQDSNGYIPKDGFVPTANVAVQLAFTILSEIYGADNIKEQQPYRIRLENDIWIITGSLPKDYVGGTAYIEIHKQTGQIMKISHGK